MAAGKRDSEIGPDEFNGPNGRNEGLFRLLGGGEADDNNGERGNKTMKEAAFADILREMHERGEKIDMLECELMYPHIHRLGSDDNIELATGPAGATLQKNRATNGHSCVFGKIAMPFGVGFLVSFIGLIYSAANNSNISPWAAACFSSLLLIFIVANLAVTFCEKCRRESDCEKQFIAEVATLPAANPYDLLPFAGKSFTTHDVEKGVISVGDTFIHLDPETLRLCYEIGPIDLAQVKALYELQTRRA